MYLVGLVRSPTPQHRKLPENPLTHFHAVLRLTFHLLLLVRTRISQAWMHIYCWVKHRCCARFACASGSDHLLSRFGQGGHQSANGHTAAIAR